MERKLEVEEKTKPSECGGTKKWMKREHRSSIRKRKNRISAEVMSLALERRVSVPHIFDGRKELMTKLKVRSLAQGRKWCEPTCLL